MNNIFFEEKNISQEIREGNYDFFSINSFFIADAFRLIKFIIIIISFILNLLLIISYIKIKYIKKIKTGKNSFSFVLIINILIANFIHTFSYLLNWMLFVKDNYYEYDFKEDERIFHIGALLIGNPYNLWACSMQGFLMVFSSLSQDTLINILFYFVSGSIITGKIKLRLVLIILGYGIPLLISFVYLATDNIGINFRYCFVKRFSFDNEQKYFFNDNYMALTTLLYAIRGANLIISSLYLCKIIKYVKKEELNKMSIISSVTILITQIIIISFELLNMVCDYIIDDSDLLIISDILISINSLDGIIFPLIFSISSSTFKNLFCKSDRYGSIIVTEEEFTNTGESFETSFEKIEKNDKEKNQFSLVRFTDTNNFDISF